VLYKQAQIIVTQGDRSLVHRAIGWFTRSYATHALVVTGPGVAVEASLPRVKESSIGARIEYLRQHDRAFAVLDLPGLSPKVRQSIAREARSYIGRRYDVAQIGLFALTGQFWNDGPQRLVCSRLITAAFEQGADIDLFPESVIDRHFAPTDKRIGNIRAGYIVPADLFRSRLVVTHFEPSSKVPTVEAFLNRR
jgi:hypothetical protein